eukprot:1140262-Pelagomonas_calceolata.AAC.3
MAAYQSLLAVPFDHNVHAPARSPRHMHLDLSQHVMRNVSRFRLRAHTLKVETAAWDTRNALICNRCSCDEIQDEAHALPVCRDTDVCALRRKHAYLFNCFSGAFSPEQPYLQQASAQAVYDFLLQHNNKLFSLRAHTLRVDRVIWSRGEESAVCDGCNLHDNQDEAHVDRTSSSR